jgi:hypothetical protein
MDVQEAIEILQTEHTFPSKSFTQWSAEERTKARRIGIAKKTLAKAEANGNLIARVTSKNFEAGLVEAPPSLVNDEDWRAYQDQLRDVTPRALLTLQRLLEADDDRVKLQAVKEVLDRRWGKPAQTVVQENKQTEVVYSSSVLDAMHINN